MLVLGRKVGSWDEMGTRLDNVKPTNSRRLVLGLVLVSEVPNAIIVLSLSLPINLPELIGYLPSLVTVEAGRLGGGFFSPPTTPPPPISNKKYLK